MEDAARPLRLYPLFMMGKMELRKCEDVQKWRQDDTPPVGLHFLEDSRSTKQPEKKGKNK